MDTVVLTGDKIGKGVGINEYTNLLDILISNDKSNVLSFDNENKLLVRGLFIENTPDSNSIAWYGVRIDYDGVTLGMPDQSNPMQFGKDTRGNIWVRGALTNVSGAAILANSILAKIPDDFELDGYPESGSLYQLANIQTSLAGNTTALFLRMMHYNQDQTLAISGSWANNSSIIMNPMIIGKAKFKFTSSTTENAPSYLNVTWQNVTISNVNIQTGNSSGTDPLQIGKDTLGNIWVRGCITNIASSVSANGVIANLPTDHQLLGYQSLSTWVQMIPVQSMLAGQTAAIFLRFRNYNSVQSIAFSAAIATGTTLAIQPSIIGRYLP